MRFILIIACVAMCRMSFTTAKENGWSWEDKKEQPLTTNIQHEEPEAAGTEFIKQGSEINSTEVEQIIEHILVSNRQGRNVDGFDEVYSDPNVQNALQKGDDVEARNIIKDRLCSLGLMQVCFELNICILKTNSVNYSVKTKTYKENDPTYLRRS